MPTDSETNIRLSRDKDTRQNSPPVTPPVSNGNASVEHVGLGHLFEHAISASDLQVAKPDPLIYEHFAECFEVAPEEIVYVGDHPAYDVVGSIEAGYQAVWINREQASWPEHLPDPQHQVSDLHQLEALLSD